MAPSRLSAHAVAKRETTHRGSARRSILTSRLSSVLESILNTKLTEWTVAVARSRSSCTVVIKLRLLLEHLLNIQLCRGLIFSIKGAETGGGVCFDDRGKVSFQEVALVERLPRLRLGSLLGCAAWLM